MWLCALAGACIVDGRDPVDDCDPGFVPDNGICVEETATVDVLWDPQPDCPQDATTAQIVTVDEQGYEAVYVYWCDDFAGVAGPMPLGTYEVYVNLTDTDEIDLYAQSFASDVTLAVPGEVVERDFIFLADQAFFEASWQVTGGCAAAGIATVDLVRTGGEVLATAPCGDGLLETAALPLGDYQLTLQALAPDGQTVVDASSSQSGVLEFGNQLADLGLFNF